MTDRAAFSATYSDFRLIKGRKVVQFVFEIPLENADAALTVLGGMPNPAAETWCAIARLDLNKTKEVPSEDSEQTSPTPASAPPVRAPNRLAMRAGILCNDPGFWKYLEEIHRTPFWEVITENAKRDLAARFVRQKCGVQSRADILPNTQAATVLDWLETDFTLWRDTDKFLETA